MCTYGRFTCVERSIYFFLNQDYIGNTELLIYNTDTDYPLFLSPSLRQIYPDREKSIVIINNNTDYITNQPYDNIGAIRRDALQHASGDYYICWDDDDIFLPWNICQCVDGLNKNPDVWAWKPFRSMFWKSGEDPEIAGNVMEASIISRMDKILEFGFSPHQGGGEHLSWEKAFRDNKKIVVDKNSIPAYCFNWADEEEIRGHKQSGTFGRPDNFQYHKDNTNDHASRPLDHFDPDHAQAIYDVHIKVIKNNSEKNLGEKHPGYKISQELVEGYLPRDCLSA